MPRYPRLKGREIIKALNRAGFEAVRIKRSHHFLRHSDGRTTLVPIHSGDVIGPGLLAKILRDAELEIEGFEKFFKS